MLRFNRLVLTFRLALLIFLVFVAISFVENWSLSLLDVVFLAVLGVQTHKQAKLLLEESFDLSITEDGIIAKHVISGREEFIPIGKVKGYQVQSYDSHPLGFFVIKSFFVIKGDMVVIRSNFRGILYL